MPSSRRESDGSGEDGVGEHSGEKGNQKMDRFSVSEEKEEQRRTRVEERDERATKESQIESSSMFVVDRFHDDVEIERFLVVVSFIEPPNEIGLVLNRIVRDGAFVHRNRSRGRERWREGRDGEEFSSLGDDFREEDGEKDGSGEGGDGHAEKGRRSERGRRVECSIRRGEKGSERLTGIHFESV